MNLRKLFRGAATFLFCLTVPLMLAGGYRGNGRIWWFGLDAFLFGIACHLASTALPFRKRRRRPILPS